MTSRGDFGHSLYGSRESTLVSYHRTPTAREKDTFNNLCDNVSGKIFLINKNVSKLENISKDGDSTTVENEKKIHDLSQETNKLANDTKVLFKDISEYTRVGRYERYDHRQQQYNLLQDKLRREFENSLSRYQAIQNVLSLRMKEYIQQEIDTSKDTSALIDISVNNEVSLEEDQSFSNNQRTEQMLSHERELEEVKERQERIQQIESDILNVNEIFRDLALLVHEQGSQIDSIESNIEHAAINVEGARKSLLRAKDYQKSARKKMCCLAVVSIVVAIILGLIIYYSVK